jgi:Cu+-exporting ATPase
MCSSAVESGLESLDGVKSVSVSLAMHSARIEYDDHLLEKGDLIDIIEAIGYEAFLPEVNLSVAELSIIGMTCSMCSQGINAALDAMDGVHEVSVSLSTNSARVEYDPSVIVPNILVETIEGIGYECSVISALEEGISHDRLEVLLKQQQDEVSSKKTSFLWSLVGALPIVFITMVLPHTPFLKSFKTFLNQNVCIAHSTYVLEALVLLVLCTPVQFGCGWPFYRQTFYGLRRCFMGMDVLVAVGTTASYGYAVSNWKV